MWNEIVQASFHEEIDIQHVKEFVLRKEELNFPLWENVIFFDEAHMYTLIRPANIRHHTSTISVDNIYKLL